MYPTTFQNGIIIAWTVLEWQPLNKWSNLCRVYEILKLNLHIIIHTWLIFLCLSRSLLITVTITTWREFRLRTNDYFVNNEVFIFINQVFLRGKLSIYFCKLSIFLKIKSLFLEKRFLMKYLFFRSKIFLIWFGNQHLFLNICDFW